jgi:hypothetical protein
MRHFRPPIHAAMVAATLVAGLASYQGVDKLVLARGGHQYGTASEPGHDTASSTSTTVHHDPGSTTSTTVHHEPAPSTSTTSTTAKHETGSSTSTTVHHETGSSTSTTVHHEPTRPPSTTTPPPPPPTTTPPTVPLLSFYCMTGMTGGQGAAKCSWSQSKAPDFHHYRLTREIVGTPRQTIFESTDRSTWYYYDLGLTPGTEYSYIIEAYDAGGHLVGHSSAFHVTCCGGGAGTT